MEAKKIKSICDMCEEEKECYEFEGVGYRVWICEECLSEVDERNTTLNNNIENNYIVCECCGGMKCKTSSYTDEDGIHNVKECEECAWYENENNGMKTYMKEE